MVVSFDTRKRPRKGSPHLYLYHRQLWPSAFTVGAMFRYDLNSHEDYANVSDLLYCIFLSFRYQVRKLVLLILLSSLSEFVMLCLMIALYFLSISQSLDRRKLAPILITNVSLQAPRFCTAILYVTQLGCYLVMISLYTCSATCFK